MMPLDRMRSLDRWTRHGDRALGVLFLKDPVRTSLGLVLGSALSSLSAFFEPALRAIPLVDVAGMSWWSWLAPGILIMHLPTIVHLLKKPSVGSHNIDVLFALIDRGNFSDAERRQHYRRLIERFVESAAADHALQKKASALTKSALD